MPRDLGIVTSTLSLSALLLFSVASAEHQTPTVSPVNVGSSYPFEINVQTYDFGAADLPTLQSFAAGHYDGKWVMLAGRTNGMHGFASSGSQNFPTIYQNRDVWVIDPVNKQVWSRSLQSDPGVGSVLLAELSSTNTQHMQIGERLYVAGGYGGGPTGGFTTFNSLSSIDLAGLVNWVQTGAGSAADHIRTIHDDAFRVTGGAMYNIGGRTHLVFGQNFSGGYNPNSNGVYTNQVRSFDIIDDGTDFSIANYTATTPDDDYRRRDLNVFPTLKRMPDNSLARGLEVLAGVFTPTNGAWTVPVKIDANGQPTMADPNDPNTFRQAMSNYESAKVGFYSQQFDRMTEVLFGGITLRTYDESTQSFVQDDDFPFTSQITQVTINSDGSYMQDYIGDFPLLTDQEGKRLLFGANAMFFPADGLPMFDNGVIDIDQITEPTLLGYIYGGIVSNSPHTRNVPGAISGASDQIFTVMYTPIPEPASIGLLLLASAGLALRRSR